MILAAGRGERLRPLTDHTPKPLIKVGGIPLIEHHIIRLAKAGITDIVINLAWLGEKIESYLQDGSRWGVNISYSWEKPHALETAGGIIKALPLLANAPINDDDTFLVINGDIYLAFDFKQLPTLTATDQAALWLVPNPEHNAAGDFDLVNNNVCLISSSTSYTFSGVGLYKVKFFNEIAQSLNKNGEDVLKLGPSLKTAADKGVIKGELLTSFWADVGTVERLQQVNSYLKVNK